jgi:hypothetical protein
MRMRDRLHVEGGFEDEDGSSPLNVWIFGWDDVWMHVDFVVDLLPPSPFLARVLDYVDQGIADSVMRIERGATTARYFTTMDPAWVRANWPEIVRLEASFGEELTRLASLMNFVSPPEGDASGISRIEVAVHGLAGSSFVAAVERCIVRLLGYWHRIFYTQSPNAGELESHSMPPGDLRVRDGCVEILSGGRRMSWTPQYVPAIFRKNQPLPVTRSSQARKKGRN